MSERAVNPGQIGIKGLGAGQPLVISFLFRINRQGQSKFCEQADAGD
jgi:hypothetical protein